MIDDEAELVAGISRWVSVETPTGAGEAINRLLDLIGEEVCGEPVGTERVSGRDRMGDSLILRAGPASDRPGILVLSHLDTVHPLGEAHRPLPRSARLRAVNRLVQSRPPAC